MERSKSFIFKTFEKNYYFEFIRMDEVFLFQKLSNDELIVLSALKFINQ